MDKWLVLVLSLPTTHATVRQRAWRALKSAGAGVLRDGVYVLPDTASCRATLSQIATTVQDGSGTAILLRAEDAAGESLRQLFDRSEDYAALQAELDSVPDDAASAAAGMREVRRLRKTFDAVAATDFFPSASRASTEATLLKLERRLARTGIPDEPADESGRVMARDPIQYQQRVWATRQRPWVDRLASAWLIRRFIDRGARFTWLAQPAHCPADAVGFDFDGAEFTHVGNRVTFEVLCESFGLHDAAIQRMALLVHHLDVGGSAPPEAAGIESLLSGLRATHVDDQALLDAASAVFDALHADFARAAGGES